MIIDDILKAYGFEDDCRANGTAAEILTVGMVAAKHFQNHHERALSVMARLSYLHGQRDWLYEIISLVATLHTQGETFIIDSMPVGGGKCICVCTSQFSAILASVESFQDRAL